MTALATSPEVTVACTAAYVEAVITNNEAMAEAVVDVLWPRHQTVLATGMTWVLPVAARYTMSMVLHRPATHEDVLAGWTKWQPHAITQLVAYHKFSAGELQAPLQWAEDVLAHGDRCWMPADGLGTCAGVAAVIIAESFGGNYAAWRSFLGEGWFRRSDLTRLDTGLRLTRRSGRP